MSNEPCHTSERKVSRVNDSFHIFVKYTYIEYMYTHIYQQIHAHLHTYIYTYMHVYIRTFIYIHIYVYIQIYRYTRIYINI